MNNNQETKQALTQMVKNIILSGPLTETSAERLAERIVEPILQTTENVSVVSHEIRNALSIIYESVRIVSDEIFGQLNDEQKKSLSIAKKNIERLERLIDNILDISKIEAGKMEIKCKNVDISQAARDIIEALKIKAQEKNIDLTVNDYPDSPLEAYADPDRLSQILINLISNSIKFTGKGGKISVSVIDDNDYVKVRVSDTGVGIAKENINKLFSEFTQFDTKGKKGTGLGLVITKNLVELHGGSIWVDSKEGRGTEVTFTLQKAS